MRRLSKRNKVLGQNLDALQRVWTETTACVGSRFVRHVFVVLIFVHFTVTIGAHPSMPFWLNLFGAVGDGSAATPGPISKSWARSITLLCMFLGWWENPKHLEETQARWEHQTSHRTATTWSRNLNLGPCCCATKATVPGAWILVNSSVVKLASYLPMSWSFFGAQWNSSF